MSIDKQIETNGEIMSVVGWVGFVWIVINTLLSLNGLYNTHRRGYKALILPRGAARRSYALVAFNAAAVLAVLLYSSVTGAIFLAAIAWVCMVPFAVDIRTANTDMLHTTRGHTFVRAVMVLVQFALVSVMMFA